MWILFICIGVVIAIIISRDRIKPASRRSTVTYSTPSANGRRSSYTEILYKRPQDPIYDMDTLDGINRIPVPAENYHHGDWKLDRIDYLLQRKATEHKRNGRMDLAIACLRKSNELSDYEERPFLGEKEYMRLYKYIKSTGDEAAAEAELAAIRQKHPEFWDKRFSNLPRIQSQLKKNAEQGEDLVFISTNSTCPICSPYNRKIFSISGRSKGYPPLPKEISRNGGFCPNCIIGITAQFQYDK